MIEKLIIIEVHGSLFRVISTLFFVVRTQYYFFISARHILFFLFLFLFLFYFIRNEDKFS